MRKWIIRFVCLYVFNVVVLLLIGLLFATVRVGWAALWAGIILTAATIWLKPLLKKVFRGAASSLAKRAGIGEKLVQYAAVYVVEFVVWLLTVWFSGVDVRGWFWGYVLPPLILLVAWIIYDAVDDGLEARAGRLYDSARGRTSSSQEEPAPPPPSPATEAGRREVNDGLTDEQRRMLDDLG